MKPQREPEADRELATLIGQAAFGVAARWCLSLTKGEAAAC